MAQAATPHQQRRTTVGAPTTSSRTSSSSSSSSSRPADKRPRYNGDDKGAGGAAAAGGKGATNKKPSKSSSRPTVKRPHGGPPGKPVEQYDLATGRTIAHFDSQRDAARAIGIDNGGISGCARGEQKSAGGFGWRNPGTGAAAAASGNVTTSATATTAARNSTTVTRPRTTSGGAIPSRFHRSDPYNVSLSKGTINSTLILFLIHHDSFIICFLHISDIEQ